ncbi:hypothetical protein [Microbacterium aureliae]
MIAQVGTALLLAIAVVGAGSALSAWTSRRLTLPLATRIALIPTWGLVFVGSVTLVVGHLWLLGPWLPFGLAGIGVALFSLGARGHVHLIADGLRGTWRHIRRHPIALGATSAAVALGLVATAVAPFRTDELEYHWPAPLAWAEAGGWNDSPFRHADGYAFMEVAYTAAATHESYLAAHLLHYLAFLALGFAVAGAASSLGVRGIGVTAAAALAMPVVWDSSYVAYNDVPVATMTITGAAVVLASPGRPRAAWIAGALAAVAVSIKLTGIAGAGLIGVMILTRYLLDRRTVQPPPRLRTVLLGWLALAVPCLLAVSFWLVRCLLITGDIPDTLIRGEPSADALSRLPSGLQQALAPLLPFVGSVVGSAEPWGGRLGPVLLLLIPGIVYAVWRKGEVLRRFALAMIPAWAHWIVLGLRGVRTRFHMAAWALMVVGLRVAVEDAQRRSPRSRLVLEIVWTVCILAGLLDVSLEMVRRIATLGTL